MMGYYCINSDDVRARAIKDIRLAPFGHVVTIKESTRSIQQNAMLHSLFQSLHGKEWAGRPRNAETWKLLMVSAHAIAAGRPAEVILGLEGEMVNIRESTAQMSVDRMASLISYVQAWIDEHECQEAP